MSLCRIESELPAVLNAKNIDSKRPVKLCNTFFNSGDPLAFNTFKIDGKPFSLIVNSQLRFMILGHIAPPNYLLIVVVPFAQPIGHKSKIVQKVSIGYLLLQEATNWF